MPPSPSPDEASGGSSVKDKSSSFGRIFAVYAERVRSQNQDTKPGDSLAPEVREAMIEATTQDEDLIGPAFASAIGETTIPVSSDVPPDAVPSEAIDVTELVEDVPPKAAESETPQETQEGKEYSREVDNSGMRDQFLAAGGIPSNAPPPPTETNTSSSMSDLKRKDILGRLKSEYDLELGGGNGMPLALLNRIDEMVFGDIWPAGEDDTRRTIKLLLTNMDAKEYAKSELFSGSLESLKRALKAELDKRHVKPHSKKRKGPPPLPHS